MEKVIFFENCNNCVGEIYKKFIDYAFSKTDYFMLVYVNYYGKGYNKEQKYYRDRLRKYEVKTRSNPSWPGTPNTWSKNSTYKVVFYKNNFEAMEILKEKNCISDWSRPYGPEDLAFFNGNKCWFCSVGHEKSAMVLRADKKDIDFLEKNGLAKHENIYNGEVCYDLYDEIIEET